MTPPVTAAPPPPAFTDATCCETCASTAAISLSRGLRELQRKYPEGVSASFDISTVSVVASEVSTAQPAPRTAAPEITAGRRRRKRATTPEERLVSMLADFMVQLL